MVVGFTTTYATVQIPLRRGVLDTTLYDSLSVTCGRLMISSTNKTGCHDITEILLNVALNTMTLTLTPEQK
jgi:hypothetical protein